MDNKILVHSANSPDVYHWGINGQQWGKRRYQNEDGSLTPLGRIHYGVGEAKERSKIKIREMKAETKSAVKLAKAQAKAAKAVANAEKEKLEAKTKDYRNRKEADNIVELERIKAQREADRQDAKNEAQLNKNLAEATKENAEAERSSSRAVKTVVGILAAAGVGYLLYRAASHGEASASTREAAEEAIKKVSNKPASELVSKSSYNALNDSKVQAKELARQTKSIEKAVAAAKKAEKRFATKDAKAQAKELARQQAKIKEAINAPEKNGKKFAKMLEGILRDAKWQDRFGISGIKHSNNNGLILVHSAKGPDVQHWGILGMKWGVRRWQNEDGTLTPEGRIHYGRKEAKQFSKAKTYYDKTKTVNESKVLNDIKRRSGEYRDLDKHYEDLRLLGDKITQMNVDEFTEHMHGVRNIVAEELGKYLGADASMFIKYDDSFTSKLSNIKIQSEMPRAKEARAKLEKEDLFDERMADKDPKRAEEAAKLGLKALAKQDGPHSELDPNDKGYRDWFIWEDQTIGLATIADMVNKGKTKSEIVDTINKAKLATVAYDAEKDLDFAPGIWQLAESGFNYGTNHLLENGKNKDFIDYCIEIKKEESKIKHSDYDGGNTICLTKLF